MTEPRWSSDDVLLADLQGALAGAGAGEAELEAGRSAFRWRTDDGERAALTFDSLVDDHTTERATDPATDRPTYPTTERGAADAARRLVFDAGSASVQLDVLPDRVVGRLVPGTPGDVVVQSREQEVGRARADDAGTFTVAPAPQGLLVRFRCSTRSGTLVTDWIRL